MSEKNSSSSEGLSAKGVLGIYIKTKSTLPKSPLLVTSRYGNNSKC